MKEIDKNRELEIEIEIEYLLSSCDNNDNNNNETKPSFFLPIVCLFFVSFGRQIHLNKNYYHYYYADLQQSHNHIPSGSL